MTDLITEPGVYDIPAADYHADPVEGGSLSSTGARRLVDPRSCPALFRHLLDEGQQHQRYFDVGHGAHHELLGVGEPIEVIDAKDYKTKTAQQKRDDAYAAGRVPLLTAEHEQVRAMAAAARAHPDVIPLLDRGAGVAEQTLAWGFDTPVRRRAMIDWLPEAWPGRTVKIVDYKTCDSAAPDAISKRLFDLGYIQQADWYLSGLTALELDGGVDPEFWFIFQEKKKPYLVTVCRLDEEALYWGHRLNDKAIEVYQRCVETGHWPAYAEGPITVGIPAWASRQLRIADERGDFDISPYDHEDVA